MIGYIIALLVFLVLISFIFLRRDKGKVVDNGMRDASAEAISRSIREYCLSSSIVDSGKGINPVFLMQNINKANKTIAKKVSDGKIISESEKWFFENYHLVYRYVYSDRDDMKSLPHIDGIPRIVGIAKIIVNNSLNGLDVNKIETVMDRVKDACSLCYAEIREFDNALSFALTEQIYILAVRLLRQERYKELAYRRKFEEKYLSSAVYSYYSFKIGLMTERQKNVAARRGLNEQNVTLNYNNVVMHNGVMAKTLFTSLREASDFFPAQKALRYLGAYGIIDKYADLSGYSVSTCMRYFDVIEKVSLRIGVSEEYTAECLVKMANKYNVDVSKILFDNRRALTRYVKRGKMPPLSDGGSVIRQRAYVASIVLFTLAVSSVVAAFVDVALGILSFVPLLFVIENVHNYFLEITAEPFVIPECAYSSIPYEHSVAIVISEFVGSFSQFVDSLRHAEEINASNGGENVSTVMLLDVKGGSEPVSDLETEITNYLDNTVLPTGINVFIRKKVLQDGVYKAHERKRGALNAINKLFATHYEEEFYYIYDKNYFTPKYIIALDADNELLPGEAREMVNMMAHPYNEKYDLLSCHSRYNLYSLKTRYSSRFLHESGCEVYPNYSGLFYRLFRRDIYCGKGIYRVSSFYNKMEGTFPSGKILSHDVIEGSLARTGGGPIVFEDAPVSFLSDRSRKKRWQRGDIQLLPFLSGRWRDDDGILHKEKIEPLYKYIMLKNVLGYLKEPLIAILIIIGLFLDVKLLFSGLVLFSVPYIINEIKILRGLSSGVTIRNLLKDTIKNVFSLIEDFFMLGYYSVSNTLVFVGTLLRMASGKNMLEWKTYYSVQTGSDFSGYAREFCLPIAIYAVVAIIASIFDFNAVYLGAYVLITYVIVTELYLASSRTIVKNYPLVKEEVDILREYAARTYKYFTYMSSEGDLIADNLQIKPYKGISPTTSPTNIGFGLLSHICAYKFGFITLDECMFELNKTIEKIKTLPKWKGNLYNWYDVKTAKPVNNFVSSVDSGNFLASLIIAKEFCKENSYKIEELNLELLINNTDLNALFDKNRNLFYLGHDGEKYCGHYDLLNSESRILSMVYIALSHNIDHYLSLQRNYSSFGGNTLLSWSGTAFETLMPELFFSAPKYSNMAKTVHNVVKIQNKYRIRGVWGISESGYYAFDENLKYQYYAFGIGKIALRNEPDRAVVSPYSSILCFGNIAPTEIVRNLAIIKEMGGYGEYGFFESIDMDEGVKIVSSFMTHHQGMILCALTNYLCDNAIKRLFLSDVKIRSVMNIYNELPPKAVLGAKYLNNKKKSTLSNELYFKNIDNIEQYYQAQALTDGDYTIYVNAYGGGFSKAKDIYINKYFCDIFDFEGSYFFVNNGKEWNSPSYFPFCKNIEDHSVSYSAKEIIMNNSHDNISQNIALLNGINGEVRKLTVDIPGQKIAFFSSLCLNNIDAYSSHPTYNGLFTTAYVSDGVLFIKRSSPDPIIPDRYIAFMVKGVEDINWECNEQNFIGHGRDLSCAAIFSDNVEKGDVFPSLGDVLYPCVGFTGVVKGDSCQVVALYGEDERRLSDIMRSLPDDVYSYAMYSLDKYCLSEKTNELLGEIIYRPYSTEQLNYVINSSQRELFAEKTHWKKHIAYFFSENDIEGFASFLSFARDMNTLGLQLRFSVVTGEGTSRESIDYINNNLRAYAVIDYELRAKIDSLSDYAFIILNSDMTFRKSKIKSSDLFYKKRKSDVSERPLPDTFSISEGSFFRSGRGGFNERDEYICTERTALPYSDVICDRAGGMVISDNGGGFFYFGNSRENKSVRFDNDPVVDEPAELLFVSDGKDVFRINDKKGGYFLVARGKAEFRSRCGDICTDAVYSLVCGGKGRVIKVDIEHDGGGYAEFIYGLLPQLDWKYDPTFITSMRTKGILSIFNLRTNRGLYVNMIVKSPNNLMIYEGAEPYAEYYCESARESIYVVTSDDRDLIESINANNVELYIGKEEDYFNNLSNIDVTTRHRDLNIIMRYLPYQVASSRLNGKLGYYQVGGATGFRDQLQDCLAFLHSDPDIVKEQILSSAARQYAEGDVMHWWHEPALGLRSRITDDKLFLPLAVSEYLLFTEEYGILEEKIPYLSSAPLRDDEKNRYEVGKWSQETGSLMEHCLKAIKSALRYGEHGLLIMGSGDWNDGMDSVCAEGRGESVFNSMLCYEVMVKFSQFCEENVRKELLRIAEELKAKINDFAFESDRYKRLFSDDGNWLGGEKSDVLKLDLLVQAYSVISGVAKKERAEVVLDTAAKLVDRDAGIIKLLYPPLDKDNYLGYISAYPKGVRENGGQYTHAAIWYLIALARTGRQDEAYELFRMINPVAKCADSSKDAMYKGEPYVFAGDVYSNEENYGQMGWSWYTGSAAWAYRFVVEELFGIRRRGEKLLIEPKLPKALYESVVNYRYKDSVYSIVYKQDGTPQHEGSAFVREIKLQSGKRERVFVSVDK